MKRAGRREEKRERERETACIRKMHYKNGDDDYSCETKDENRHVQCERLNEFWYTVKASGVFRVYWTVINGARRRRSFLTGSPPIWKRVSRDYVYFLYVTLYTVYWGDTWPGRNNTEIFLRRVGINETPFLPPPPPLRSKIFMHVSDRCKSCGEIISLPLTVIYSLRRINTSERLQSEFRFECEKYLTSA